MAGSNQSTNLTGMLSGIAGAIGQMGNDYFAQNVRDYMAPDLDPSSEESLMARQKWAMRNGYQDQANALAGVCTDRGSKRRKRCEGDDDLSTSCDSRPLVCSGSSSQ